MIPQKTQVNVNNAIQLGPNPPFPWKMSISSNSNTTHNNGMPGSVLSTYLCYPFPLNVPAR